MASQLVCLAPFPSQDLLKHTPEDHPDHPLLLDAQRNIKQVAERINKGVRSAEEAERHARVLQEIEAHIEGMEDVRAGQPHPASVSAQTLCLHLWSPGVVSVSVPALGSVVCLPPCLLACPSRILFPNLSVTHTLAGVEGGMCVCVDPGV